MSAYDLNELPKPLAKWVIRLAEVEMPIFSQTVAEIGKILAKEEYSSLALARVILQDPSMTAKVLKLSNSVFYNPGGTPISTVSRAAVVLGFKTVQDIGLSIAVIESLLRGKTRDRVLQQLARSIHAATQARSLAAALDDAGSEEVFIAALLLNLGQMAFWCFAGSEAQALERALSENPKENPEEIEEKVLGFRLRHLTIALAHLWKLSPLVTESAKGTAGKDRRGRCIHLGHEIAREAEKGWGSPAMRTLADEAAKLTGQAVGEVGMMLQSVAEQAVENARTMGAKEAARLIPVPNGPESGYESSLDLEDGWNHPDAVLQIKILREIMSTTLSKPDLNLVLDMVLEGLQRGVGMDRTVLAMAPPGQNLVKAKYVLGSDTAGLAEKFQFELRARPRNLFVRLMETPRAVWVENYDDAEWNGLLFGDIFDAIGRASFFAEPILFGGQVIGLFYCDRFPSGRQLDQDAFENFKLFVQQANLCMEHVAQQHRASQAVGA